jgi:FkbM family methyltransferase
MRWLTRLVGRLPRSWIRVVSRAQWRHPLLRRAFDAAARQFQERDGVIQQGAGKGLRLNPGRGAAGYILGTSEPRVQAAIAKLVRPGMTVYDVGANVGFLAMISARLTGPGGRVLCFEPVPGNARWIEHNARLNDFGQVSVRPEALGGEDGEARFLVSSVSGWGKLESVGASTGDPAGEILVAVRRLDGLLAGGALPRPDFIKMDVEGAEADVLAGARETLRRDGPTLLIELHGTNEPVARALADVGYEGCVLGSPAAIVGSPWNAHVVAVPAGRPDRTEIFAALSDPGLGV